MPIAIKGPTTDSTKPTLAAKTARHRQRLEKQTTDIKKQVAALRKERKPAKRAKPRKRA